MSTRAHVFMAVLTLAAVLVVVRLVRRHRLMSKYSLLWVAILVVLAPLVVFPGVLDEVSYRLGISYPPAAYLVLAVAFLFLVVVQFSVELSRLEDRTRTLAEDVALLRAEVDARAEGGAEVPPAGATRAEDAPEAAEHPAPPA